MPDRDVRTIRDLVCYQYATIIAKSAFAASDGEGRLKHRGDKKFYDSIPPLLPSVAATTAQARSTLATWMGTGRPPFWISIGCWGVEGEDSMVDRNDSNDLRLFCLSSDS
jgi:hypothetical protein